MEFAFSPYLLITLLAAAICIALSVYAHRWRNRAPEAGPLIFLLLAMAWQLAPYGLGLTSQDEATKLVWAKVEYIGITSVPFFLLMYALYRTGHRRWLNTRRLVLLALIPLTTLLLMWTNEWHGLIWAKYHMVNEGSLMLAEKTYGPWLWVYAAYSYVILVTVVTLLVRSARASVSVYRRQTVLIIVAVVIPWIGNAIYIFGTHLFGRLDPTPFSFVISGLLLSYTLFNLRLLDIIPIAREAVMEVISEAAFILDRYNTIVDLNPAAMQMLGSDTSRVAGRQIGDFIPALSDRDRLAELFGNSSMQLEYAKNGDKTCYDIRIATLKDKRGVITGRLLVFYNITELKQAEFQLQQHYEREKELRKHLEEEDERRSRFIRALVHELKTPLTPMMVSSDLLVDETQEGNLHALAKNINQGAHVLNRRIDELMDVARGEMGIFSMDFKPVDILVLLRSMAGEMTPFGSGRGGSLVVDLPDTLPSVRADENRIRQVMQNLLDNAFKFSSGKELTITLKAGEQDGFVMVEVQDNGLGISPEEQNLLFDIYYRSETSRFHVDGLGLGLHLCKTIIELHGGKIWVESDIGKGATFIFTLPVISD